MCLSECRLMPYAMGGDGAGEGYGVLVFDRYATFGRAACGKFEFWRRAACGGA